MALLRAKKRSTLSMSSSATSRHGRQMMGSAKKRVAARPARPSNSRGSSELKFLRMSSYRGGIVMRRCNLAALGGKPTLVFL